MAKNLHGAWRIFPHLRKPWRSGSSAARRIFQPASGEPINLRELVRRLEISGISTFDGLGRFKTGKTKRKIWGILARIHYRTFGASKKQKFYNFALLNKNFFVLALQISTGKYKIQLLNARDRASRLTNPNSSERGFVSRKTRTRCEP